MNFLKLKNNEKESKFEKAISYLLIIGVSISILFEIIGLSLFYYYFRHLNISGIGMMFIHGKNFFSFLTELFRGEYAQNNAILFMTFGITILILTPYLRVLISIIYFAFNRNIKYTIITLFVFIILTISLIMH